MLNLCQKTKRENDPAVFGSSPQPMALMRLPRLYIRAVEVCRQKFRVFSGKAYCFRRSYTTEPILTEPHSQGRHGQRTWAISGTSGRSACAFFYQRSVTKLRAIKIPTFQVCEEQCTIFL